VLRTRLLTAAVLIPIVAGLITWGGLPYFALVVVSAVAAEVEFLALLSEHRFRLVHLSGVAIVGLCLADGWFEDRGLLVPGLGLILIASLAWQVLRYPRSQISEWTAAVGSGLYIGICASHMVRLRTGPDGLWWTLIAVPVTFAADASAYLLGSVLGRRKLAPELSSGKTVEGYLGGILISSVLGAALGAAWGQPAGPAATVSWLPGLMVGASIALLAPLGDLAVSMVKREAGAEDSGRLLPGHGGMLDRLDSLLFAGVIARTYIVWFVY
jgi:phosphatidate cytidylyltransferase